MVKTKIEALGGDIEAKTKLREGSNFIIRLPLTLAIIQALMVELGQEKYAIPLGSIKTMEDVRMQRITRVPKAQSYFKGVINLRGEIIPVMRIRLKFGLEEDVYSNATRIIIIKLEPQFAVGIIVDEVKEVVTLDENSIEKVTNSAVEDKNGYISGVGKQKDGLISLLNIAGVIIEKETI